MKAVTIFGELTPAEPKWLGTLAHDANEPRFLMNFITRSFDLAKSGMGTLEEIAI